MRGPVQFVSALAPVITRHLNLKRALGRRGDTEAYLFGRFDRFLADHQAVDLTSETFGAWCASLAHLAPNHRRQQMRLVYHLCLFRRRSEPACFLPDPSQFPPAAPRSRPFIFSTDDIVRLLRVADALEPHALSPLHRQVARLAVVLLYTTGLRRQEVVRLTLGDYDPARRVLLVRDTKFHKSRLVPLSANATEEMERYLTTRRRSARWPTGATAPLLLHHHGGFTAYTGTGFWHLMRKLYRAAGIRTAAGRSPRVHDLRFTFAVHALVRWYDAGVDVQARLPALCAYMGHGSIVSTQYYLSFVDAIAAAANARFEAHCASWLPGAAGEGGRP
jgi:site-specific recombinase XerD